jgi:hypothetical protein
MTTNDMAPIQLVTGRPGYGRNTHLLGKAIRRQRLVNDLRRGGFPLSRRDTCSR